MRGPAPCRVGDPDGVADPVTRLVSAMDIGRDCRSQPRVQPSSRCSQPTYGRGPVACPAANGNRWQATVGRESSLADRLGQRSVCGSPAWRCWRLVGPDRANRLLGVEVRR